MIKESLVKFLYEADLGFTGVYEGNNVELDKGNIELPFCIVSGDTSKDDLAVLGDSKRMRNQQIVVEICAQDYDQCRNLLQSVQLAINNATSTDENGTTVKGIDLFMVDWKMTTEDNLTFSARQEDIFPEPEPVFEKDFARLDVSAIWRTDDDFAIRRSEMEGFIIEDGKLKAQFGTTAYSFESATIYSGQAKLGTFEVDYDAAGGDMDFYIRVASNAEQTAWGEKVSITPGADLSEIVGQNRYFRWGVDAALSSEDAYIDTVTVRYLDHVASYDLAAGTLTFEQPQSEEVDVRVTAKVGFVDLNEVEVFPIPPGGASEGIFKFSCGITYETNLHLKRTDQAFY